MRLTLGASETGHLVLATVHSSSCAEALQRIVSAFPAEIQAGVAAQVADALLAVISQRLRYRSDLNIRVPECEILMATHAVKNFIRNREYFKVASALETGAEHGMWTFQRYVKWLENRKSWQIPGQTPEPPDTDPAELETSATRPPVFPITPRRTGSGPTTASATSQRPAASGVQRIEIEPDDSEFGRILKRPGE